MIFNAQIETSKLITVNVNPINDKNKQAVNKDIYFLITQVDKWLFVWEVIARQFSVIYMYSLCAMEPCNDFLPVGSF